MVVPPCRRLWDPRMSRLARGPRRSPGRRSGDPQLSENSRGPTFGRFTYRDPHLGQSSPGTPGCRAGTPRWYSTVAKLGQGRAPSPSGLCSLHRGCKFVLERLDCEFDPYATGNQNLHDVISAILILIA